MVRLEHLTTAEGNARLHKLHSQDLLVAYAKVLVTLGTLQLAPGDEPKLRKVTVPSSADY